MRQDKNKREIKSALSLNVRQMLSKTMSKIRKKRGDEGLEVNTVKIP